MLQTGISEIIEKGFRKVLYVITRTVAWIMGIAYDDGRPLYDGSEVRSFIELRLTNMFYRAGNEHKNKKSLKEYEHKYGTAFGKVSPYNIPVCSYRFMNLIPSTSENEAKAAITREHQLANFLHDIIDFIK